MGARAHMSPRLLQILPSTSSSATSAGPSAPRRARATRPPTPSSRTASSAPPWICRSRCRCTRRSAGRALNALDRGATALLAGARGVGWLCDAWATALACARRGSVWLAARAVAERPWCGGGFPPGWPSLSGELMTLCVNNSPSVRTCRCSADLPAGAPQPERGSGCRTGKEPKQGGSLAATQHRPLRGRLLPDPRDRHPVRRRRLLRGPRPPVGKRNPSRSARSAPRRRSSPARHLRHPPVQQARRRGRRRDLRLPLRARARSPACARTTSRAAGVRVRHGRQGGRPHPGRRHHRPAVHHERDGQGRHDLDADKLDGKDSAEFASAGRHRLRLGQRPTAPSWRGRGATASVKNTPATDNSYTVTFNKRRLQVLVHRGRGGRLQRRGRLRRAPRGQQPTQVVVDERQRRGARPTRAATSTCR